MDETKEETLPITCYFCQTTHTYKLEVARTVVDGLISRASPDYECTRIFICPIYNRSFQTKFVLRQDTTYRIKNVGEPKVGSVT